MLGGNALQALNGSVNQFWVSHSLGVTAVTAIGNANIVMMLMLGVVFGVSMAVQHPDRPERRRRRRADGQARDGHLGELLRRPGARGGGGGLSSLRRTSWHSWARRGDARDEAEIYLRIVFLAMPFMYFFTFLQMALRGTGDSRTPFFFMVHGGPIDIALNPLLIRGIGPFPKLGIAGSATSTFVAQGISLACLVVVLYRQRSPLALSWSERGLLRPGAGDPALARRARTAHGPADPRDVGGRARDDRFRQPYGAVTAAAFTSASQVWTFVQLPAMALGSAVSSMAAQNVGAGRWERVSRVARAGVWCGLAVTGAVAAADLRSGRSHARRCSCPRDRTALPIARHINEIVLWGFVFFSITFVLSGVVRATGAVWAPLLILVVSMYVIRIPFATLLKGALGADAIWWSFPLGTIGSAILTSVYYLRAGWRKSRMIAGPRPVGQAADAGLATPAVSTANP